MNKEKTIYLETERCKHLINSELKKAYSMLNTVSNVESNPLFLKILKKTKMKAFDSIKSVVKPYVIYNINKYYYTLEN